MHRRATLSELIRLRHGAVDPRLNPSETFFYYSIPTYDTAKRPEIAIGNQIDSTKLVAEVGDILVSKLNPRIKRVWRVDNDRSFRSICSTEFVDVVPRSPADREFIYHLLSSDFVYRDLRRTAEGTTNSHVRFKPRFLETIALGSLPCRSNWERIAEILSTIDEAIEQTEALIAKTQQIKAGLMHDLFTRGVTADGQLRPQKEEAPQLYKESPLGWIPKEWEVDAFGNRVSVIDPNPSHRYPDEQESGLPICSTENFRGDDGFDLSRSKLMPPEVLVAQQQRCHFAPDDVVFARKGRIGLARRYGEEPKVFSHTVVLFKTSTPSVDQAWLLWLSRSHWFLDDIDRRMNSNSGVPTLGVAFINAVTVPFPPRDEQRVINQHLDEVSARESAEAADLRKLRNLKAGLMHDLLTGRVPVSATAEVDVVEVAANV